MKKIDDTDLVEVNGAGELFDVRGTMNSDDPHDITPPPPTPPVEKPGAPGPGGPNEKPPTEGGGGLQDPFEG